VILAALGGLLSAFLMAYARAVRRWYWYLISAAVAVPALLATASRGTDAATAVFLALVVAGAWVPEGAFRGRPRRSSSSPEDTGPNH